MKRNRKGKEAPTTQKASGRAGKMSRKRQSLPRRPKRNPEVSDSSSRPNKRLPKPERVEKAPRAPRVPLRERLSRVRTVGASVWERVRRPVWLVARIALVILVAAGAVAVGRLVEKHVRTSPAFATKTIQVEGADRLTEEEIHEAAGLAIGANVFDLAPEDAQARLVAHPWIADATVRRKLPDTFEITVREHEAVAVLALTEGGDEGDSLYLVAEDASVFKRVTEDDPLDLPVITGVDRARFSRDPSWRSSLLVEIVALLHDYRGAGLWRREPIAELHLDEDDSLSMYIGDDAARIALGHGPFRGKLRRLRRVLDELRSREARPAYVYLDNVRRPDRVTVRLR